MDNIITHVAKKTPIEYHAYVCHTGCAMVTLVDKQMKRPKPMCPKCGTRDTMEYVGKYELKRQVPIIDLKLGT